MKIDDIEIDCPNHKEIIERLKSLSRINLLTIHNYQVEFPRQYDKMAAGCSEYCLFLGHYKDTKIHAVYDLYHFPYYAYSCNQYSTAIVFGNGYGDYKSGLARFSGLTDGFYEDYRELMKRDLKCGLIKDKVILEEIVLGSFKLSRSGRTSFLNHDEIMKDDY